MPRLMESPCLQQEAMPRNLGVLLGEGLGQCCHVGVVAVEEAWECRLIWPRFGSKVSGRGGMDPGIGCS